jgi:hypothetical protein
MFLGLLGYNRVKRERERSKGFGTLHDMECYIIYSEASPTLCVR